VEIARKREETFSGEALKRIKVLSIRERKNKSSRVKGKWGNRRK